MVSTKNNNTPQFTTSSGSGSYIGDNSHDGPKTRVSSMHDEELRSSLGDLIASTPCQKSSVDKPTMSRTTTESEESIDHTAALLGMMDEIEDDDDEREISGFSPSVSLDLELDSNENRAAINASFEKIWSAGELNGLPGTRKPTASRLRVPAVTSLKDSSPPIDTCHENSNLEPSNGNPQKTFVDDNQLFFFDSRLIAQAVEDYGQRKRTDMDSKRKQATLKVIALKEKASSAINLKAKKAQAMLERKVVKNKDVHRSENSEDNKTKQSTPRAMAMKNILGEKAKKARDMMLNPQAIKGNKSMDSLDQVSITDATEESAQLLEKLQMKMCSGMKIPNLALKPPKLDYRNRLSTISNLSVIGDVNKLVRPQSNARINEERHSASSPPAIMQCPSTVSSNNSQIIDEDGFLISPTSSIDLISPDASFDCVGTQFSPKSPRRKHLPPSAKKSANCSQPKKVETEDLGNKIRTREEAVIGRVHSRSISAA